MPTRLLFRRGWFGCLLLAGGCRLAPPEPPAPPLPPVVPGLYAAGDGPVLATDSLREASGLAASTQYAGTLYALNDGGDAPRLYALDTLGRLHRQWQLPGARNRDWEALALHNGRLFVADIGDNLARHPYLTVYHLPEAALYGPAAIRPDSLRLAYPDHPRDAEALFVDGDSLYVITKRERRSRVYAATWRAGGARPQVLRPVAVLPYFHVTDASLHPDGQTLLVRTLHDVFLYRCRPGERLVQALQRPPLRLPFAPERQGEAVAWSVQVSRPGFYTLGERSDGPLQRLRFHRQTGPLPALP